MADGSAELPLCVHFGTKQSQTFALTSLEKECGFHGKPHINWTNHAISCSELIMGRGQTDKDMPLCSLPKNHSSKSVRVMSRWSHAYILILKKLNKSIPWFIHIDLISDLIDDLINLIKSMPTLVAQPGQRGLDKCSMSDLKIKLRALGIIRKVITGPWMRLLSFIYDYLEINENFSYAHEHITRSTNDASPLLSVDEQCTFSEVCKREHKLKMTKEKLSFLDDQHETMKDELKNVKEGNIIKSKKGGKTFSHRIREDRFNLQNYGVAQRKVSGAIQVKSLTNHQIVGSLPSYSTQNRFLRKMTHNTAAGKRNPPEWWQLHG